ncbi:MAG: DUF664 domain-containing protein, partial [Candidatus Dormibacteraceae bacterium]
MTNSTEPATPATGLPSEEREREALLEMLGGQRAAVHAILGGLSEAALRTPVVPSGWTPLGLVEHLTGAELFWFHIVATGGPDPAPPPVEAAAEPTERWQPERPFEADGPVDEVLAAYVEQCRE